MADEEKIKQFCDIPSEIIDSERRWIDNIYEEFYDISKLSKKDYEERCNLKDRKRLFMK